MKHPTITRRWKRVGLSALFLLVIACLGYGRFQVAYGVSPEYPAYPVQPRHDDDTLRIAIIGDSWAERHYHQHCDTIFDRWARQMTDRPVKCLVRGHAGRTTKEIYQEMFKAQTPEAVHDVYCTQSLLEQHPDFCVVMAGINDIGRQCPPGYYTGNYERILRTLLGCGIRPVVMEIPQIDVERLTNWRKWYQQLYVGIASFFLGADKDVALYQQAMRTMLERTGLADSVLYIAASEWDVSPAGPAPIPAFYTPDGFHLTNLGYRSLDSCIVKRLTEWE